MSENEIIDLPGNRRNVVMDSQILTNLMSCPRLADFIFNRNFQSINGKSNSLECGSIVHVFQEYFNKSIIKGIGREEAKGFGFAAAEMYIRGCKDCMDFTPIHDPLYTNTEPPVISHQCGPTCILKPVCGHKAREFPGVRNTPKDSEGYKTGWQWVLDTCDQYCIHYRNDHWVPLEVEVVKGIILYEDDEIRILWKAKLDLIVDTNQGIYPVDHKTMKANRDTISMNNQFIGQCLIMNTRNVFINKIGFQTTLKPIDRFIRTPISYSAARLFEWQSETLPYYAKLLIMYAETGHYPPNFTHCDGKYGKCPFLDVCTSDPGMREEEIKRLFIVGPSWNPSNEDD